MERRIEPKEGYARFSVSYDDYEKYWDTFEHRHLKPYIAQAKGKEVLDAGAGTGRLSVKLFDAGAHVTALDISSEMLAILTSKNKNIQTVEGDMEDMPFDGETFDMAFSSLALVHLKNVEPFLDECYRVLKDEGILVLVNVHYRKPMVLKDEAGSYTIQCFNHYPKRVRKIAEDLAFGVMDEIMVYEGDDVWISQILVLKK
jgi:ubiquinone/menaquinone biosynthesis C-methylase UbiE